MGTNDDKGGLMKKNKGIIFLMVLSAAVFCAGRYSVDGVQTGLLEPSKNVDIGARSAADENESFIGIVRGGTFHILRPTSSAPFSSRLTRIAMQEARSPDSAEIDLNPYEGQALMIQGHNGGGWIYSAHILDKAGPLLTQVVLDTYSQPVK